MKVFVADINNTIKLNEKRRYKRPIRKYESSLLLNITLLVDRLFCNLLFEESYLIKRGKFFLYSKTLEILLQLFNKLLDIVYGIPI